MRPMSEPGHSLPPLPAQWACVLALKALCVFCRHFLQMLMRRSQMLNSRTRLVSTTQSCWELLPYSSFPRFPRLFPPRSHQLCLKGQEPGRCHNSSLLASVAPSCLSHQIHTLLFLQAPSSSWQLLTDFLILCNFTRYSRLSTSPYWAQSTLEQVPLVIPFSPLNTHNILVSIIASFL